MPPLHPNGVGNPEIWKPKGAEIQGAETQGCVLETQSAEIQGCKNRHEIAQRIEQFKQSVSALPPPNWNTFFDEVLATAEALEPRPELVVYQLKNSSELHQLFASDHTLRKLIKKCEGFHVVFHKNDRAAIARRLTELGYLMPIM